MERDFTSFLRYIKFVTYRYDLMVREHVSTILVPYYIQYDTKGECARDDNKRYQEMTKNRDLEYAKDYNLSVADSFFEEWQMSLPEFKECVDYRIKAFKKETDEELRDEIFTMVKRKYMYPVGKGPLLMYEKLFNLWCLDTINGVKFYGKTLEGLKDDIKLASIVL